jgi:riboflavin-specific deaminase-like protein
MGKEGGTPLNTPVIETVRAVLSQAADYRRQVGRPYVTLSYAQTLDGSIARRRGAPLAISGPLAQQFTHQLRALHDAILVGVGTVISDNPRLTVRLVAGPNPQVVIVDSRLRTPLSAQVLRAERGAWLATTAAADRGRAQALERSGARPVLLPALPNGWVDLGALLDWLGAVGVNSLMVEGGSRIITSLLAQGSVNQVILTIAPLFVGGLRAVGSPLATPTGHPLWLANLSVSSCGDDLLVRGELAGQG